MSLSIVTQSNNSQSPFDSIRSLDEDGNEYWSARDLQSILGYKEWRKFDDAIERAKSSLKTNGHKVSDHIVGGDKMVDIGSGSKRKVLDYQLSRMGAYMVAMNGDPRKQEIASAQSYFAIKTREAEVIIPKQNEQLEALRLQNENLRLENDNLRRRESLELRREANVLTHGKELVLV